MSNNCDHLIDDPVWFIKPEQHGKRPPVLAYLDKKIHNYYSRPASVIPSLNFANGSERQQRSERRESCVRILGAMLHYLDLVTMRVGIPSDRGEFKGLTMEFLADKANLNLRRAERAMRDLKESGLVKVFPVCEKLEDCTYKGFAAIRTISDKLFRVFGLRNMLKKNRKNASNKLKQAHDDEIAKRELMEQLIFKPVITVKDHIADARHATGSAKHVLDFNK